MPGVTKSWLGSGKSTGTRDTRRLSRSSNSSADPNSSSRSTPASFLSTNSSSNPKPLPRVSSGFRATSHEESLGGSCLSFDMNQTKSGFK